MDKNVPTGAAMLLKFIYETDAGKAPPACYEIIFGNRQNRLSKPITQMNLGDLIDAQKNWSSKQWVKKNWGISGAASSASGAAQFMRDTLIGLAKELHLSGTQLFDANLQDRLGYHLLKRRGYEDYMAGKIDRTEFGKRLAMEWASFPVLAPCKGAHRSLTRGQSYYAGDGVNHALVAPDKIEALLTLVKKSPGQAPSPPLVIPEPKPVLPTPPDASPRLPTPAEPPQKHWLAALIEAIAGWWRGK